MNKAKTFCRVMAAIAAVALFLQVMNLIRLQIFINENQCRVVGETEQGEALWFCDSDGKVRQL